jgi:hypothetical protein
LPNRSLKNLQGLRNEIIPPFGKGGAGAGVSGRDFASIHDRPKPEVFITRLNSGALRLAKAIAVKPPSPARGEGGVRGGASG